MNTIKKLMTLLLAMLALVACDDNSKDEPGGDKSTRIYLEIFTGKDYYICDTDGKMVYECPEGHYVSQMTADGKNWYGVLQSSDGQVYRILKNGNVVMSTPNEIRSLCVENGDIYTLQWDKAPDYKYTEHYTARICKNETQLYEYDSEEILIYGLTVNHGDLTARAWYYGKYEQPTYWMNGKIYTLPIDKDYASILQIVKDGNDTLAVVQGYSNEPLYCWHNGEIQPLPNDFGLETSIHFTYPGQQIALVGGVPYIAGYHRSDIVLIINGQEHSLNTKYPNIVCRFQRQGNDVYTLTSKFPSLPGEANTRIFKGTEPIEIDSKIYLPNVKHDGEMIVYGQGGDTFNLDGIQAIDFVVLDK